MREGLLGKLECPAGTHIRRIQHDERSLVFIPPYYQVSVRWRFTLEKTFIQITCKQLRTVCAGQQRWQQESGEIRSVVIVQKLIAECFHALHPLCRKIASCNTPTGSRRNDGNLIGKSP